MNTTRIGPPTAINRSFLAALVALCLAGCQSHTRSEAPRTFRVMTYNIHHGEGLDGRVDLPRIAELIKGEQVDIVALQEVDKGVARTARRDLPAELAALTGMTSVFSNNYHYQGGEYGNAVLTRLPVKGWTNLHYQMIRPGEQRGLLQVVLTAAGSDLVFVDTHLDFRGDDTERLMQVAEIEKATHQYRGRPLILCGDFNDTPGSRTYARLAEAFIDAWMMAGTGDGLTIPAGQPRKRIDYLWLSKDKPITALKLWVPRSQASDHLPVVGEFRLR